MSNESQAISLQWSEERAFRTGVALARATLVLGSLAAFVDFYYWTWGLVAKDLVLVAGAVASLLMTRRLSPARHFVWIPLYASFVLATIPTIWVSGGIQSPWLAAHLAVMAAAGAVVQTRVSPVINLGFVLLNVLGWVLIHPYVPVVAAGQIPPASFIAAITALCMTGVGYCIDSFLRTERGLAEEIGRRYAELFEARQTLSREESANQAKSGFLANISHELRTPLGAILGYAQLLQDENVTPAEKATFAKTIERNGIQLARLVNDLLDLSKVEAGRIELESIDCGPAEIVREIVNLLSVGLKGRELTITVRFLGPVPETVRTDPVRLKQILTNVIGNALKFTKQGMIAVTLFYQDQTLSIAVRDSGRGISLLERQKLFKPFSQADASMTRRFGGTGLGLNLSRELARLLGGDLELTWSQLGFGSEFTLRLPVQVRTDVRMLSRFDEVSPSNDEILSVPRGLDLRGVRILVVDDSPDNRDIVRRYMVQTGAMIDEAQDGIECVRKADENSYDLILMDIQMPGLDGLQATSILRERCLRMPIIALTAHAMKEDRQRCLDAGCDDHLPKPIQRAELLGVIERFQLRPRQSPDISL